MNDPQFLFRQRPARLPVREKGNRANIIFVTICTKNRRPILNNYSAHAIILEAWKQAPHWLVGRYVILPDHIHFFCTPNAIVPTSLSKWIQFWKSWSSKNWLRRGDLPLWQQSYWDRQLRTGESYDAKWHYVRNNPIRHGLVSDADAWPYQGQIHVLEWHDVQ